MWKIGSWHIIMSRPYSDKYYVWLRFIEPFVLLLDCILHIILIPFPYQCCISNSYYREVVKAIGRKRTKEFEAENKPK